MERHVCINGHESFSAASPKDSLHGCPTCGAKGSESDGALRLVDYSTTPPRTNGRDYHTDAS